MQYFLAIADAASKINIDLDEELTMFLCAVIVFLILTGVRNRKIGKNGKNLKMMDFDVDESPRNECDDHTHDDKRFAQIDKALVTAFEEEDHWQVLKCWNQLKYTDQSSIHLSMVIRAMRSCNKGAYFIVNELRNYFKAHPQIRSIGLINDLLEPMSRRLDDAQLVDHLVKAIPSINLVKDSRTYEIILTMHAANGQHAKAQEVLAEMKLREVAFSPCATVAVLNMGLHMGNIDVVLKSFSKLKPSWDVRSTWAVSLFALERHKTNMLTQIVELAFKQRKICSLSSAFVGMMLPEEVLNALQLQLSRMSELEATTAIKVLQKSGHNLKMDSIYKMLVSRVHSHSKFSSSQWEDASTSEGSRSESEEEGFGPSCSPPRGLAAPPGF
jgi:hypothetical protein